MDNAYIKKMLEGLQKDKEKANAKIEAAEQEYHEKLDAGTKELAEIAEAEAKLSAVGKGIGAVIPEAPKIDNATNRLRRTAQ
jgi:hypothetical protein